MICWNGIEWRCEITPRLEVIEIRGMIEPGDMRISFGPHTQGTPQEVARGAQPVISRVLAWEPQEQDKSCLRDYLHSLKAAERPGALLGQDIAVVCKDVTDAGPDQQLLQRDSIKWNS